MSNTTEQYILLLGSDTGDREFYISESIKLISNQVGRVNSISTVIETKPWGFESDNLFLNQAVLVETKLAPLDLLGSIQTIEKKMGRVKQAQQWSSRIIDIDILCSKDGIYLDEKLIIPHKWLHKRDFALRPLCQLVPNWKHPLLKQSYKDLLLELKPENERGINVLR